jgi:branched-chain amino acid transport system permease protein
MLFGWLHRERAWRPAVRQNEMLSYLTFIATIGGIYGLLALSLNLIWGGAGMVNLGLAGFFAVGAYASALMTTVGHGPIAAGWLVALIAGGLAGLVVTLSTTRLREDYLAIVTLGFAEVVRLVAANEIWLTRGTDGISGIPGPWKRALGPDFNAVYFGIVMAVVAVVFFLTRRIDRSPYGRVLRAIREDAQVAQVAGKNVLRFKTEAFALSAAIAGLAGALYGHFTSYIAPDLFLPLITVYIFLAVASGGTGRPAGALIGAFFVMALLESARFLVELIPAVTAVQRAALKEMLIAVALIVVLRLKPSGVLPERIPPAPRPS